MDGNGRWKGEIWGWKEREKIERVQERFLRWMMGVSWRTPGYMIREELQREKMRLKEEGHGVLRKGWRRVGEAGKEELGEIRKRAKRGGRLSAWEKERQEFFEMRGRGLKEVEEEREKGTFDFS